MISTPLFIGFIGGGTALAVFAIWAKTYAGEAKKAEKWERGEIIKQLLALSEQENRVSAFASPPTRNMQLASTPLRKGALRHHKPKQRYSNTRPAPPLRPSQSNAKIEEKILAASKEGSVEPQSQSRHDLVLRNCRVLLNLPRNVGVVQARKQWVCVFQCQKQIASTNPRPQHLQPL
jgi:hypothetical protein